MATKQKVTFKIILTSDPNLPFRTYDKFWNKWKWIQSQKAYFKWILLIISISVPEEAPFSACIKYVAE